MDAVLTLRVIWTLVALGLTFCAALWLGSWRRAVPRTMTEPPRAVRRAA